MTHRQVKTTSPRICVQEGDSRSLLDAMVSQQCQVDSVVTDPPYGISFMGMGWDKTQVERDPAFWRLVFDVLKPGGFCFAFSGARTGHWQACAMEQAGFVMFPMHGWVFGTGFPKPAKADRAVARLDPEEATKWAGWAYGAAAHKPAIEPIYLAQKPVKSVPAALVEHGTGAVNIDGCRVPANGDSLGGGATTRTTHKGGWHRPWMDDAEASTEAAQRMRESVEKAEALGRYPANLFHDDSACVTALFPVTGAGTTARFFNAFPADIPPILYNVKADASDRAGSRHPTVKPVALIQHLIRHITPPGGTVLDPFAGSGTTGEAARREGFDCLLMEQVPENAAFIRQRFGITEPCRSSSTK